MAFFRNICVNLQDCIVRRTYSTPPPNPLLSLILQKNPHL